MLFWTIFGVAAVLSLVGGFITLYQIVRNHAITNLSDRVPWGLYIEFFFLFSALGAGTLLFSAVIVLFKLESYYTLVEISSAFSFSALITAGIVLAADLGKPFRVFRMIIGFNPASPLTWDFVTLSACIILNIIYLSKLVTGDLAVMIWAVLSVCAAISLVMLHALFLTGRVEAGYRSQPFQALNSITQALLGGAAMINLLVLYSGLENRAFYMVLLVLILLSLLITAVDNIGLSGSGGRQAVNKKAVGMMLAALVILIIVINLPSSAVIFTMAPSALILISVFLEKSHMVRVPLSGPVLPDPYSQCEEQVSYKPSIAEWSLVFGGLGICVLISQILFLINITS